MNSGIYKILNKISNKFYIGSAINLTERWRLHQFQLNKNSHRNPHLQAAWNKYWSVSFEFIILELIKDKNKLLEREQYWIDLTKCCDRNIGYNVHLIAGSPLGLKRSKETIEKLRIVGKFKMKGKKHSDKTKKQMSEAAKDNKNSFGFRHTEEAKQKIGRAHIGLKSGRNKNKWPCEEGFKCKCEECMKKKRKKQRDWRNNKPSFILIRVNTNEQNY
jgi:group I intron endonuclease